MEKLFKNLKGPFIEVAGPTQSGYELVDFKKLDRAVYTSNIYPGAPKYRHGHEGIYDFYGKVDFMASVAGLPVRDNFLGAFFCSCLSTLVSEREKLYKKKYGQKASLELMIKETGELREMTTKEAWRTLEPGGLYVLRGHKKEDTVFAETIGFKIIIKKKRITTDNCIFQKI